MNKERVVYLDVLRVFSIFCMMLLHVAASNWDTAAVTSLEWQVFNFYDSLVRFCVPIFIMISGVFFLDNKREYTIQKLFSKNICRIVSAFCFWSVCYAIFPYIPELIRLDVTKDSLRNFLSSVLCGSAHLWFLYTLTGLYLIVPFLRKITADIHLTKYFLVLSFIFCNLVSLLHLFAPVSAVVRELLDYANIHFVLGYSGYFILGYYLANHSFSKPIKIAVYSFGVLSAAITIAGTSIWSLQENAAVGKLYGYLLPNTYFASVSVFLFFKETIAGIKWSRRQLKAINLLASLSFGMYLVHNFVNFFLHKAGLTTLSYPAVLSVPVNTLIVFAISFVCIYLLSKIPVLNKYIM